MYWNAQFQIVANLDRDRLTVAVQICALSHHMQRIKKLSHKAA
jgi:hypothetical protein